MSLTRLERVAVIWLERRFRVTLASQCGRCAGRGLAGGATCPACDGTGRIALNLPVTVT